MQLSSLWSIQKEFRVKVILLASTFGCMMGTQSVWRSMKGSIFSKIVGVSYVADAKLYSMLFLIPLILFYSKLVDVLRRHQLVYVFTLVHGIGGMIFAYLIAHPIYGVANTAASPDRLLGWVFYLFMESFSAFMATTFWSFANSINKPKDAKNYYGFFVVGSKLGGIISAGTFWLVLQSTLNKSSMLYGKLGYTDLPDATVLSLSILGGSLMLILAAFFIFLLMRLVPGYYMHGYEAAYQFEKQAAKEEKVSEEKLGWGAWFAKALDGLKAILQTPYVLGIFMLALFHDIVMTIFDFFVLQKADAAHSTVGMMVLFYCGYYLSVHTTGLLIALFGTTPIQRLLGNRTSLLIYPTLCMAMVIITLLYPTTGVLFGALVLMRALNYALNHPIREVLYIPTTKEIKFKSKAWTDAFGTRIAKGSASVFFKYVNRFSPGAALMISSSFMFSITFLWVIISFFLGRTLQDAIDNKKVIGAK